MFKFFDIIINFLQTIVSFVVKTFELVIYVITFIVQGVSYAFTIILYLPAWVLPFVVAVIAWCVIMFLLNR